MGLGRNVLQGAASGLVLLLLVQCGGRAEIADDIVNPSLAGNGTAGGRSVDGGNTSGGSTSGIAAGTSGNAPLQTAGSSGAIGSSGNGSLGDVESASSGSDGSEPSCVTVCSKPVDPNFCPTGQVYWSCFGGQPPKGWQAACKLMSTTAVTLAMCCPVSFTGCQ
jgi:hypothetical protein